LLNYFTKLESVAMNVVLIGFGNVAQGLLSILQQRSDDLRVRYGFNPRIVGIATRSRGTIFDANGIAPRVLLNLPEQGWQIPNARDDLSTLALIQQPEVDVVIEASPSNFETGQPALDYCYAALQASKHLILVNKGPLIADYTGLKACAEQTGVGLYFEGTVMSGTPSLRLAQEALAGCKITRLQGILNGTTNYILSQMENGMTYGDALKLAQEHGYAETDPTADVEGWDAAGKLVILAAAVFGIKLKLAEMKVSGISGITSTNVQAASANGERWKLIAEATPEGGSVRPVKLPISDPLAGVTGATNAVTYTTDFLGDVTLIGAGAGRIPTGFALLSDLLAIHRSMKS
jgi:homoserine dehydrogenase